MSGYDITRSYTDWGATRAQTGGWHAGHDMFAPEGRPVVAVEGGTAEFSHGRIGGFYVILYADSGNVYYYAHLLQHGDNNLEDPENPTTGSVENRVESGVRIGSVSNTGYYAVNTPFHLHFGYRYGSFNNHVNPWPYIQRYCV